MYRCSFAINIHVHREYYPYIEQNSVFKSVIISAIISLNLYHIYFILNFTLITN